MAAGAGSGEELAGVPAGSSDSSSDSDYDEQLAQKMKQRGSFTGQVIITATCGYDVMCNAHTLQHSLDQVQVGLGQHRLAALGSNADV